jgi:hypothetical protein
MQQALTAVAPDDDLNRVMRSMTRHRVLHMPVFATATWPALSLSGCWGLSSIQRQSPLQQ